MKVRCAPAIRALPMAACFAVAAFAASSGPAHADDRSRVTLLEENDSLYFNSDKHYTQGFRFSYLGPDVERDSFWNGPFNLLGNIPTVFSDGGQERSRRYALEFGQSIFTPKDIADRPPDPRDRPYAGWLYGGFSLLQDTDRRILENFEFQAGLVGPGSLGKEVQNDFHQFIDIGQAQGWSNQLQNEPGVLISYERKMRLSLLGNGKNGVDVIPEAGGTVGNVMTYAEIGGLLRIGKNLQADYGPTRIRPSLSGTDYFNGDYLDGPFGFYIYAGVQGRAVGRNIFLDGNSFRSSRSVDKKDLVADLQAGFALFWSTAVKVDFSVVRRTEEFYGQRTPDVVGTASLSFSW
jgi:hypothetical protein